MPATARRGAALLAEADDELALHLSQQLHQLGLEVRRVATGQDAFELACFGASRPALVVMNLRLPGLSGIQATLMLRDYERRRQLPAVPVLGCSSLARPRAQQAMLRAGMDAVVELPAPSGRLAALAQALLAQGVAAGSLNQKDHDGPPFAGRNHGLLTTP